MRRAAPAHYEKKGAAEESKLERHLVLVHAAGVPAAVSPPIRTTSLRAAPAISSSRRRLAPPRRRFSRIEAKRWIREGSRGGVSCVPY
jgi:hypothetical protein